MAQFIIDNETSDNESEPEEVNDINYGKMPNQKKGPVTGNLASDHKQATKEDATQANCKKRGNAGSPTEVLDNETGTRPCENNNYMIGKPSDRRAKMYNVKITPVTDSTRAAYHLCYRFDVIRLL